MTEIPEPHGRLVARNTILNLTGHAFPLLVGVASIPVIVDRLGTDRFGILSLAWVVLGYFSVFDLGLGRATTKFVAEALEKDDLTEIRHMIGTATIIQGVSGVLGSIVLLLVSPLLVNRILRIPTELLTEASGFFYLLALSVPAVLVSTSLRGVLEATQRFDFVNAVRMPLNSSYFILPLVGAFLGWGLTPIVLLIVIAQFGALFAHYWLCLRALPSLRPLLRFSFSKLRRLLGFGGWVSISSIVGPILIYLDRFVIGSIISIAAVAYYAAPYEMITRLLVIPTSIVASLFPAFSRLGFRRLDRAVHSLLIQSTRYLLLIVGPIVMITIALSADFIRVWLGSDFVDRSTVPLQVLSIGVLINSLAHIPYSLLQALGRPDLPAKFHLIELPVHVLLVVILVRTWGLTGAALAWLIRVGLDAALLFWAASRLSSVRYKQFLSGGIIAIGGLFAILGASALALSAVGTTWLRLFGVSMLLIVASGVLWRYLLHESERARVLRVLPIGLSQK